MGNKMGHAVKLDATDDSSASELRNAADLSIADPADGQILDEQTVEDILESDPYRVLDRSIGDDQDDKDDITALSRTYVLKPSTLNERMSLEELAELSENSDDSETTMEQRDPANK